VQKALAFIDTPAIRGISVDDVVKHINCSRRLADLRFHELQGQSILNAITARRLDEVKRLLTVTNEKIDTIAVLCGYTNPNYLKNLFKKHFGLSMRDFRQRVKGVI
jgi:two-component system response regulator YesN